MQSYFKVDVSKYNLELQLQLTECKGTMEFAHANHFIVTESEFRDAMLKNLSYEQRVIFEQLDDDAIARGKQMAGDSGKNFKSQFLLLQNFNRIFEASDRITVTSLQTLFDTVTHSYMDPYALANHSFRHNNGNLKYTMFNKVDDDQNLLEFQTASSHAHC